MAPPRRSWWVGLDIRWQRPIRFSVGMKPSGGRRPIGLLRYLAAFGGPVAGALIALGGWLQIRDHRSLFDSPLVLGGVVLAWAVTVAWVAGQLMVRPAAAGLRGDGLDRPPLRTIIGGANVPTTTMRVNATWPLAVLELGEARFRLRVRGAKWFGALTLDAGPADVKEVYPAKGRLGASGVGFTDQSGRDYYFWTSAGAQILYGLSYFGFPISPRLRTADKVWTTPP